MPLSSGRQGASSSPPPPQRSASTGPSVKIFDEVEHVCQPNDTFESISKKYFMGSPNYAKALQRHNQNHARASEQMTQTGKLTPGERVYVPQAYILEERYADAIPKSAAGPSSSTVPATFVAPGAPPPVAPPSPPLAPSSLSPLPKP